MIFSFPFHISRPVKKYAWGGISTQINPTTYFIMWGNPIIGDEFVSMDIHGREDVRIGDIVRLPYNLEARKS